MNYAKVPLTIPQQIALLKSRGLKIKSDDYATYILSNISYYRLSAYLLSFQKFNDNTHIYMPWASFDRVIRLYIFDRELRLICIDAIERIEVALRCRISHEYSIRYGNNWYENPSLYTSQKGFENTRNRINGELNNTKEVFIQHYKDKYTTPVKPPSWMVIEILSFGQLSWMFKELKSNDAKKAIADHFGVSATVLESWLENIAYIRNICAHHSRLWNRKLTKKALLPKRPNNLWIKNIPIKTEKLYLSVCLMEYLLDSINQKSPFYGKLCSLFCKFPEVNLSAAGFHDKWKSDLFWVGRYTPIPHRLRRIYFNCKNILSFKSTVNK